VRGEGVIIDGFNLIITVEAALSGGVLIRCRDGCIRDLSGVHGSYRSVSETNRAIAVIGEAIEALEPESVMWVLDKPISNSGRLAERIRSEAAARGWNWTVEVVNNPDALITSSPHIAVSADSTVVYSAARWLNMGVQLVENHVKNSWVIDLSGE
jgi:hypothetical protein